MAFDNKSQRFQITLPSTTVQMINDIRQQAPFNSLSGFLNEAARIYAVRFKKASLKRRLKAGYLTRAERDRAVADEWDPTSNELLWDAPAGDSTR